MSLGVRMYPARGKAQRFEKTFRPLVEQRRHQTVAVRVGRPPVDGDLDRPEPLGPGLPRLMASAENRPGESLVCAGKRAAHTVASANEVVMTVRRMVISISPHSG